MKFFTLDAYRSWYDSAQPFEESSPLDEAAATYRQHLKEMEGKLPPTVLDLARLRGVDDGVVVEVHHLRCLQQLLLVLRCGDLQVGYYDLALTYEGASLAARDEWMLAKIARSTKSAWRHESDIAYHEIDRSEHGWIEHRLLFHPGRAVVIRCRDLRWEKIDRPDREIPTMRDRFPGGPTRRPRFGTWPATRQAKIRYAAARAAGIPQRASVRGSACNCPDDRRIR